MNECSALSCHRITENNHRKCNGCLTHAKEFRLKRKLAGKCFTPACNNVLSIKVNGDCAVYCEDCKTKHNLRNKLLHKEIRKKAIEGYGGKCACCGESDWEFLNIDHVKPIGGRKNRIPSITVWREVIKENFPPEYQVLCWNCNCAKKAKPMCPHQENEYYSFIGDSMLRALQ